MKEFAVEDRKIVSRDEWIEARKALLAKEKELTQKRDQLSAERRELPWVKVDKEYVFEGPDGKVTLADLFDGRDQLIIYHFMWRWDLDQGCPSCSFLTDNIKGGLIHLENHEVKYVAVSRAPIEKLAAFQKRLGWQDITMVSSYESDFNFDHNVSFTDEEIAAGEVNYNYSMQSFPSNEAPGISVFFKDENGDIYNTYSSFARGLDNLLGTYNLLDLTPKGRNENSGMEWVRYNDKYGQTEAAKCH